MLSILNGALSLYLAPSIGNQSAQATLLQASPSLKKNTKKTSTRVKNWHVLLILKGRSSRIASDSQSDMIFFIACVKTFGEEMQIFLEP
jgi:hypothetical protein